MNTQLDYPAMLEHLRARIEELEKQLAFEKARADDAWKNARAIDNARTIAESFLSRERELRQAAEKDAERLDWVEGQYGLHREIEITYVVDGYQVEFTHDGNPTDGRTHFGETLREAIDAAILASQQRGKA